MRSLLLSFLILTLAPLGFAQEESTSTTTTARPAGQRFDKAWVAGASTLFWNENLELQQGITNARDVANYSVLVGILRREFNSDGWGFHVGAFVGNGKVNGGGNASEVSYTEGNIPVSVIGVTPRVYYTLSDRVNIGAASFIFLKSLVWPDQGNIRVNSGRTINAAVLLDMNVRLFDKWEFTQGLGGVSENNTLWQIGISRRF